MVFSNKQLLNNIIHLNDKMKQNSDASKALHILQEMRLLVNHMTLNLHDLNKDIHNESQDDVENEKYYYLTMYESLINSIKSIISMYENKFINNEQNLDIPTNDNNFKLEDVHVGNQQKVKFLEDLKQVNGSESVLFNPENLLTQLKLNKLKNKVEYLDNSSKSNNIFSDNSNIESLRQVDPLFSNSGMNDQIQLDPLFSKPVHKSHTLPQNQNNLVSENEVLNSLFGNISQKNIIEESPKKKQKIIFLFKKNIPNNVDNIWNDFKKLNKSDCLKVDSNKHEDYANKLGFNFENDFELKKLKDNNISNFEDELTLDNLVNFSKDKDKDIGYESDMEDLFQTVDYDNTLTLYHNPNCGHCITFYPIWDELQHLCKNKPIQLLKVDCHENSSMCSHIISTPTIIFKNIKSSKIVEFEEERTRDNLMKFIDVNCELQSADQQMNLLPSDCAYKQYHKGNHTFDDCPSCGNVNVENVHVDADCPWCNKDHSENSISDIISDDFKKLNKSDCLKVDSNKHEDYANKLGFNFENDFELKKLKDNNISNFEDELTLDNLVNFSKDKDKDIGYESDMEDLFQTVDYDNTLTLYHNPNCGHCITFYPIWDELQHLCKNKPIQLLKVDCHENSSMCSHIISTPTIIFKNIKSSKIVEFEEERTRDNLMKFIDVNCELQSADQQMNLLPSDCAYKQYHKGNHTFDDCPSCGNVNVENVHVDADCPWCNKDHSENSISDIISDDFNKDVLKTSETSETSEFLDVLKTSETSETSETVKNSEFLDVLKTSETSETSETVKNSEFLDVLKTSETSETSEFLDVLSKVKNSINENDPILIFYHKKDCEYSRSFEKIWNELKQAMKSSKINFVKKNYDELNKEMKDRLSHVPTIELMLDLHKDDKIYRYGNNSRSVGELIKYIRNPLLGKLTKLETVSSGSQIGGGDAKVVNNNRVENTEGGAKDKGKITLFFADWCGHCQQFKPMWEKLKRKMGRKVTFQEINDENIFEINKYGVQGYPTIIAEKGGKMFKFNNDRTEDVLVDFINEKLM